MKYKGYLIDLDGTMYNGSNLIPGARDFIDRLNRHDIPYMFLTNNATKSRQEATQKLIDMEFDVSPDTMYTSSMATAEYLTSNHPGQDVYVIGTDSLKTAVQEAGMKLASDADVVVMGLDTDITYDKLSTAAILVADGAAFISTNPDKKFPTGEGLVPGNGAIVQSVIETTGKKPVEIGKPHHFILDGAIHALRLHKKDVAMIGDNYETDIMTGINGAIDTIHVNTGVTTKDEVSDKDIQPTYSIENLTEWSVD